MLTIKVGFIWKKKGMRLYVVDQTVRLTKDRIKRHSYKSIKNKAYSNKLNSAYKAYIENSLRSSKNVS